MKVESRPGTPQGSWRRVEWQYDALGRRIRQTTWSWLVQSNLWVVTEDLKFVSDPLLFGRHVVDLNASNNVAVRTYVWGLDLSERMDGAGGVGGLLWVTLHTGSGPAAGTHLAAYDGNGNIVAPSAASGGSESTRCEYGPFGEPIRLSGPAATLNPFRFSTKRTDSTTDLVLYEYRAYNPALGRWLSRDPISEKGGISLHAFAGNDPANRHDILGLRSPIFGPGELCGDKSCEGVDLSLLTYIPEDPPVRLLPLPVARTCVDADALYFPGGAWTIPDNGKIIILCEHGCLSNFTFRRWPWWLKRFTKWNVGEPKPPDWPGDIPPYPDKPPTTNTVMFGRRR